MKNTDGEVLLRYRKHLIINTKQKVSQILREGIARRAVAKDVEKVYEKYKDDDFKKYIHIHVNREGIYDVLLEGLFHKQTYKRSYKDMQTDVEKALDEIRIHREQEFFARRFFHVYEQVIILNKLLEIFLSDDGWPPNRGFIALRNRSFKKGEFFDRYGGWFDENGKFHDNGTFVGEDGISYTERSLRPGTDAKPHQRYEVIRDIPDVKEGEAIPWFGEKGGGVQYELPASIDDLIENGYIKPVN